MVITISEEIGCSAALKRADQNPFLHVQKGSIPVAHAAEPKQALLDVRKECQQVARQHCPGVWVGDTLSVSSHAGGKIPCTGRISAIVPVRPLRRPLVRCATYPGQSSKMEYHDQKNCFPVTGSKAPFQGLQGSQWEGVSLQSSVFGWS